MATSNVTDSSGAKPIKTLMVAVAAIFGIIMLLAFLAGVGPLNIVYGIVGVVLLLQAGFYWWM